jgi:hypothetical protein
MLQNELIQKDSKNIGRKVSKKMLLVCKCGMPGTGRPAGMLLNQNRVLLHTGQVLNHNLPWKSGLSVTTGARFAYLK